MLGESIERCAVHDRNLRDGGQLAGRHSRQQDELEAKASSWITK
jgi:hypothetical protein